MKMINKFYREQAAKLFKIGVSKTTEKRIERAINAIFDEHNWNKTVNNLEQMLADAEIKAFLVKELEKYFAEKTEKDIVPVPRFLKVPLTDAFRSFFDAKTLDIVNEKGIEYALYKGTDGTGFGFMVNRIADIVDVDCIDNPFNNQNWKLYYIGLCSLFNDSNDLDTKKYISTVDFYRLIYNHTGKIAVSSFVAFKSDFLKFKEELEEIASGKGLTIYSATGKRYSAVSVNVTDDLIVVDGKPAFLHLANSKIEGLERKLLGTGKKSTIYARLLIIEAISKVKRAKGKLSNHILISNLENKYDVVIDKRTTLSLLENAKELGFVSAYEIDKDAKNNSWKIVITIDRAEEEKKEKAKYFDVFRDKVSKVIVAYYINPYAIKAGLGVWVKGVSYNLRSNSVLFPKNSSLTFVQQRQISEFILKNLESWKLKKFMESK